MDREDAAIFKAVHDAKKRAEPPPSPPTRHDAVTDILSGGVLPGHPPPQKPPSRTRSKPVRPRAPEREPRTPRRLPSRPLATHSAVVQPRNGERASPPRKPVDLSPTTVAQPQRNTSATSRPANAEKMRREYIAVSARKTVPFSRGPSTMRKSVLDTVVIRGTRQTSGSKREEARTSSGIKNEKAARKTLGVSYVHCDRIPRKYMRQRSAHNGCGVRKSASSPKTEMCNGTEVLIIESSEDDKTASEKKSNKVREVSVVEPEPEPEPEPAPSESDNETVDLGKTAVNEASASSPRPTPRKPIDSPSQQSHPANTPATQLSSPEATPRRNNSVSPTPPTRYQDATSRPASSRSQSPKKSTEKKKNNHPSAQIRPPPGREEHAESKNQAASSSSSSSESSYSSSSSSAYVSRRQPSTNAPTGGRIVEDDSNKEKERRAHLKDMHALVRHYLEVSLDSGHKRKVLVLEYLEDSDIHFVRFLDEAGGSVRVNLSTHAWRRLSADEIASLQDELDAQTQPDPSRPARSRVQPKRRRPAKPPRGGQVTKRRRATTLNRDGALSDVESPGGELIGATIAIRWPGNGEMFVALVVGCKEEGLGKTKHKIYYVVDESTEVIDLTTRHWVRNGPGCEQWDTSGLVSRRIIVLWDGVYDGEPEDTPLRPIPYEAFVVKYIENFRYRLLYTQGDSLEDRDMEKNTDSWELCEPGVWSFDDMPLVSWSNVAGM